MLQHSAIREGLVALRDVYDHVKTPTLVDISPIVEQTRVALREHGYDFSQKLPDISSLIIDHTGNVPTFENSQLEDWIGKVMFVPVVFAQRQSAALIRILGVLGNGEFSQVIAGQDIISGMEVAMSVQFEQVNVTDPRIDPKLQNRQEAYERMMKKRAKICSPNEAYRWATFQNANGFHGEIMTRLLGANLYEYLENRKEPLSLQETVKLGISLLKLAIREHKRSIFHRDFKPENIIILPDGSVENVDLQFSLLFEDMANIDRLEDIDGQLRGTVQYMPPEIFYSELHNCQGSESYARELAEDIIMHIIGNISHKAMTGESIVEVEKTQGMKTAQHGNQLILEILSKTDSHLEKLPHDCHPDMRAFLENAAHPDRHQRNDLEDALNQLLVLDASLSTADVETEVAVAA